MSKKISFVCDAGMGSSALGAALLRRKIKSRNLNFKVTNKSIADAGHEDIIICHQQFEKEVRKLNKETKIYTVNDFMNDDQYERILKNIMTISKKSLEKVNIKLNCKAETSDEAIIAAGKNLVEAGYVEEGYIEGMLKRDKDISVYIGNDIAIPHGEYDYKKYINETGLCVHIYPDGVKWGNGNARIVIGIAANNEEHMKILENVATKLCEMEVVEELVSCNDIDKIYEILSGE